MDEVRNWKDIPYFKDVTDEQWNDWKWQVANRLGTADEIAEVINLTEQEKADITKILDGFRVGITPYYASLMDENDPMCPVRMQAVPTILEAHRSEADLLNPLHERMTPAIRAILTNLRLLASLKATPKSTSDPG